MKDMHSRGSMVHPDARQDAPVSVLVNKNRCDAPGISKNLQQIHFSFCSIACWDQEIYLRHILCRNHPIRCGSHCNHGIGAYRRIMDYFHENHKKLLN